MGEGGGVEEVGGLAGHHLPRLPSCSQAQVRLRLRKLWLQLSSRLAIIIMIIIMIINDYHDDHRWRRASSTLLLEFLEADLLTCDQL